MTPVAADLRSAFAGPRRVWLFNAGLALACAVVWLFVVRQWGSPHLVQGPHLQWWMFAIAFYLAEVFVVHLQFRKEAHSLSLTEIGLTLGLLLASPAALLGGQLAGTVAALMINRWRSQRQLVKLFFNAAELPLCSGIAVIIFRSLAGTGESLPHIWALALVAAAVAHTTGVLLVSAVIAIAEERVNMPQMRRTLLTSIVGALATACLGLAAVELLAVRPLAVLLLAVPVVACVAAFRGYMTQREQREHVEFLYESMRATQGAPEFGLAVGQLLVAARRLLRAEYAEILLLPPNEDEGPLRSVSGAEGELLMHPEERFSPEDAAAFSEVAVVGKATLLAGRRSSSELDSFLQSRGLDDAIVGPLRGENRTFGLLVVGDRSGDVSMFGDVDMDLFDTFSGHASILLENGRLEHSLAQVTQLKEQLRHQAYHDALTGLPNRRHLLEAIDEELRREHVLAAVLYLDLDRFKVVNDTWGHAVGDELLIEFARRLRGAIRTHDLAARLGGDEFAILVRDADVEAAVATARRVLEQIAGTYSLSCGDITCHASVGVAVATTDLISADDLVRNADIAMYSVKRSDRTYTVYEAELHEELRAQRQLALELEAALERREIIVHYQPVVRLADGSVQGFEVLARWPHPTRGLLPAAEFLPIAEETGMVVDLGRLVLEQALDAARSWPPELSLWLNLAPAELANDRLVESLSEALERAGIDPRRMRIEVTESSVLQSEESALEAMRRLRDLGVSLTIDDFGTGYSSLSRLAEFPIESLKIPKPFVDRLVGEDVDEAFVDAILRLSDSLGLAAVGEGIEHAAQADRLRELGCLLGQGFFFGRPMPLEDIEPLLRPMSARPRLPLERLAATA
ncbi:MAG TPA: EAL domain-containing protein [Gaiellaceae bacterium]|nr:EAL domain-containing protein [Gaiellaceae bacterium]